MTKEQVYERLMGCEPTTKAWIQSVLDQFFSQNVVMPRGDNRHPNSEELHKAIEDSSIILECSNILNPWEEVSSFHKFTFRIKPSEPVYEWQWVDPEYIQSSFSTSYIRARILSNGNYLTEDEANNLTCYGNIYKIEETKRIREV